MTGRARTFPLNYEWDVTEELDNTTYDQQHTEDNASVGGVGAGGGGGGGRPLDNCRLYIRNIPKSLDYDGLSAAFSKFGNLEELYLHSEPNYKYGLVRYETPTEASLAMAKLNHAEPLRLSISVAHHSTAKNKERRDDRSRDNANRSNAPRRNNREDTASVSSRGRNSRRLDDLPNGEDMEESLPALDDDLDPETKMMGIQLELERLQVQEQSVLLKKQLLQLEAAKKKNLTQSSSPSNRCVLPDGRVVLRNTTDRTLESREDESYAAGAGDSNERDTICSCNQKNRPWDRQASSEGSTTPSTCVLCSEDRSKDDRHMIQAKSVTSKYTEISRKSEYSSRFDRTADISRKSVASKTTDVKSEFSKADTINQRSDATSKKLDVAHKRRSDVTCDLKYSDFYSDTDEEADETNRLIQLRNSDYMDIVGDAFKIVIALAGYPKSKMRLRQMESFQKCLTDVIDMQLKNGLLKKVPSFLDYYLNRGAIICICKDLDTRDWMVRVSPGLQERMCTNLILLKPKVKRLCLAMLKIPQACWPATAQDAFKLLQYFNPTLKTDLWKIYAQKFTDSVECTSFLIDRVSGEIIRGPTFKNVIDYNQIEFELTGYTEIYYECLLSDIGDDLCSVASRVKLLEELRSEEATPKIMSEVEVQKEDATEKDKEPTKEVEYYEKEDSDAETVDNDGDKTPDVKKEFENTLQKDILKKLKDVKYISEKGEVIVWSDETNNYSSDHETELKNYKEGGHKDEDLVSVDCIAAPSIVAMSDKTESVIESNDNLIGRGSNLNIDSNRGIAYHRRTNYLHVENELKVAITLEGYPQNKLEGTHIRRLKHLFKEYLHKDMKVQRFTNLIIPKFQDVYLSNGAVIYICDSLETKDYLTEVLPKFVSSTGLKLTFRDIKHLVRYTRVVLRLPKEQAHVESVEILSKLQAVYSNLKPDCWKYYSDVAGKQKRQFGVDPVSLDVIKSPDFDPTYEDEKLVFRIIDRQKRDVSFEENARGDVTDDTEESKALKDKVFKVMYIPVDSEITNTPLTRIRTNHYTDLIADDLKLYVGPANYPETRIDDNLFYTIKKQFEMVVYEALERGELEEAAVPKFHDMYLFDGVIFIICRDKYSREWMEHAIKYVNVKLHLNLKSTEFRGAVGIVSMVVKSGKDTDDVIKALQKHNPRLRTKYWRKISTVKTKNKLDVVLQIDKLSAQVITSPEFNKYVDNNAVLFKLGHLQSLLKPKSSLEALTKKYSRKVTRSIEKVQDSSRSKSSNKEKTIEELKSDIKEKYPDLKIDQWDVISHNEKTIKVCNYEIDETSSRIVEKDTKQIIKHAEFQPIIIEPDTNEKLSPVSNRSGKRVLLKIPSKLIPDNKEDLNMLFDLLEDKNPGLNTELWRVYSESTYPNNGRFCLLVDRQSAMIIQSKSFDPIVGGEKLKFTF